MEYTKTDLNWLMKKTEDCSERYMEAEKFILEIAEMKWYQRVFLWILLKTFVLYSLKAFSLEQVTVVPSLPLKFF